MCTFSTSEPPKVVRCPGVLNILTSKCASRHNAVHLFNISTSKTAPNPSVFNTFYFQMCFAPQRRALFQLERGRTKGRSGYLSTTFCVHSVSIYIELSLPPRCLSISCIHFVSYVDFPYWPLRHFLRFCCCNIRTSPASTTSCMHLVSISKFHPPRAIVSNKNHKQDNVSQFVGNLCELEGPRCLNRSTLG